MHAENVHLLPNAILTPDLANAWQKLNDKHATEIAKAEQLAKSKRVKLLIFLGKCRRLPGKMARKIKAGIHSWALR
jgi:hypothetical protein